MLPAKTDLPGALLDSEDVVTPSTCVRDISDMNHHQDAGCSGARRRLPPGPNQYETIVTQRHGPLRLRSSNPLALNASGASGALGTKVDPLATAVIPVRGIGHARQPPPGRAQGRPLSSNCSDCENPNACSTPRPAPALAQPSPGRPPITLKEPWFKSALPQRAPPRRMPTVRPPP
jgi:hypothetical protein